MEIKLLNKFIAVLKRLLVVILFPLAMLLIIFSLIIYPICWIIFGEGGVAIDWLEINVLDYYL